jgi:phasin family protein
MFNADNNPFDPAKLAEMMKAPDFSKMFDPANFGEQFKTADQTAMFAAQQKNMDALVAAQKAAAAGYQDLFQKQVAIFQETLSAAEAEIATITKTASPTDAAQAQADLGRKAYDKAVANLTELTDAARKANEEAFEIVKSRVEAGIKEISTNS